MSAPGRVERPCRRSRGTVVAPLSASQPIASSESDPAVGLATSVWSVVPVNDWRVSTPCKRCASRSRPSPLASIDGIVGPANGVATVRTPGPWAAFESKSRNAAAFRGPSVPFGTAVPSAKVNPLATRCACSTSAGSTMTLIGELAGGAQPAERSVQRGDRRAELSPGG